MKKRQLYRLVEPGETYQLGDVWPSIGYAYRPDALIQIAPGALGKKCVVGDSLILRPVNSTDKGTKIKQPEYRKLELT